MTPRLIQRLNSLEAMLREIKLMKIEIAEIKVALRTRCIELSG